MTPKKKLFELSKTEYNTLQRLGVLEEVYPGAFGDYDVDCKEPEPTFDVTVYAYISDDDALYEIARKHNMSDHATEVFSRAEEYEIQLRVDRKTGQVTVIGCK